MIVSVIQRVEIWIVTELPALLGRKRVRQIEAKAAAETEAPEPVKSAQDLPRSLTRLGVSISEPEVVLHG
jgi:hypothetical protein